VLSFSTISAFLLHSLFLILFSSYPFNFISLILTFGSVLPSFLMSVDVRRSGTFNMYWMSIEVRNYEALFMWQHCWAITIIILLLCMVCPLSHGALTVVLSPFLLVLSYLTVFYISWLIFPNLWTVLIETTKSHNRIVSQWCSYLWCGRYVWFHAIFNYNIMQ